MQNCRQRRLSGNEKLTDSGAPFSELLCP